MDPVDELRVALESGDPAVRKGAVLALRDCRDPRGVEALVAALDDGDESVRAWAEAGIRGLTMSLAEIGGATAREPLEALLRHPDEARRELAAEGLYNLLDPATVPAWIGALKDASYSVRYKAARALAQLPDSTAVEGLEEAANDPDDLVREAVAEALDHLRRPAAEWRHRLVCKSCGTIQRWNLPSGHYCPECGGGLFSGALVGDRRAGERVPESILDEVKNR